jgi:subtilase family serine protease
MPSRPRMAAAASAKPAHPIRQSLRHALRQAGFAGAALLATAGLSTNAAYATPQKLLTKHLPPMSGQEQFVAGLPLNQNMRLAITLPMHNEKRLDALLRDLQDPSSPYYRHYLSVAEFTDRFGPTASEYATLRRFAVANGFTERSTSANRYVLDVEAPVATIQQAFGIHLGQYRRPDGSLFIAPDREPTMDIATPVLHISGLDDFARPVPLGVRGTDANRIQANGTGPNGNYTGTDMRTAYYGGTALNGAGQIIGLIEYIGYNITDVQNYFKTLNQPLNVPIVGISVDGTSLSCTGSCDDFEPALDIEQSIAMAPGLSQLTFYIGNTTIAILNRIATDNTAKQISSSYAWLPDAVVEDPVYKEFAAQGQSFVNASGDKGFNMVKGGVWPADDANVTGVGGTDLTTSGLNGQWLSETGWADSGGGPSPNGVKIPSWQKPFVNANNKAAAARRNVPDIAAEANYDNYACFQGKCSGGCGGTSFAAPRWAGFIALVNQQSEATKKTTVGFLNPTLYKLAGGNTYTSDFHDITSGFNGKYYAVPGYDDVTGLGSPQAALINALVGQ